MRKQATLLMLPQPLLLRSEEGMYITKNSKLIMLNEEPYEVIAGMKDTPTLNLSEIADEIGWVDVEKLIEKIYPLNVVPTPDFILAIKTSFKRGFDECQSLNEKKYSEEDMIEMFRRGIDYMGNKLEHETVLWNKESKERAMSNLESISKPKEYLVEVEMEWGGKEYVDEQDAYGYDIKRPKITNNTIKVTKVIK